MKVREGEEEWERESIVYTLTGGGDTEMDGTIRKSKGSEDPATDDLLESLHHLSLSAYCTPERDTKVSFWVCQHPSSITFFKKG